MNNLKAEDFELFNHYLWLIEYYKHGDDSAIAELLSYFPSARSGKTLYADFLNPLEQEIKLNLVNRPSRDGKITLLRRYLFDQRDIQHFIMKNEDFLNDHATPSYFATYSYNKSKEKVELKPSQLYVFKVLEIFGAFTKILIKVSESYGINFDLISKGFEISKSQKSLIRKGRDFDFDINKTREWYNELIKQKEFQKPNTKPFIKLITIELIRLHHEATGTKPSKATIKYHRQQLGLTKQ